MRKFPETFEEYIKQYEFEDTEVIYDGSPLIPSFKVLEGWKHYTNDISASLNNIYECLNTIQRNLEDIEDAVE